MYISLADRQDITRAGMMYVSNALEIACKQAEDKVELLEQLKHDDDAIVVLDYTLFDISDVEELEVLYQRFPKVQWVIFSDDLSSDFVRRAIAISPRFSILLKESPMQEIRDCLQFALRRQRYICQRMAEQLLAPRQSKPEEDANLTKTETEILKDIALGLTTREIAEHRYSSFHTVNTHRKNIFRKLGVNNAHEATKYALRAGLVDSAEYYI